MHHKVADATRIRRDPLDQISFFILVVQEQRAALKMMKYVGRQSVDHPAPRPGFDIILNDVQHTAAKEQANRRRCEKCEEAAR